MKRLLFIAFIFATLSTLAQDLTDFEQVDDFKIDKYKVNVYFKDPIGQLIKKDADFFSNDNQARNTLLSEYLLNNTLYIFQLKEKNGVLKSYALRGNPKKVRTQNYFNLDVLKPDGSLEKSIDKLNFGGSFFEHMAIFQNERGKTVIGKFTQIWGYFAKVEAYGETKSKIVKFIRMDLDNSIPSDFLYKERAAVEPLFDFQKSALKRVKSRKLTITVFEYDSLGNVINKYPRTEQDNALYLSAISKEITAVTSFPFFSSGDTIVKEGNRVRLNSTLENVRHYLKDIVLVMDKDLKNVDRIEATLIIHAYSAEGHSTYDERYRAEFEQINGCSLPKKIMFGALDDKDFKTPRLTIDVEYDFF